MSQSSRAVRIHRTGGPEEMVIDTVDGLSVQALSELIGLPLSS